MTAERDVQSVESVQIGLLELVQASAENVRAAVRFYRDVLGATVQAEDDAWSQLRLGNVDLGIHRGLARRGDRGDSGWLPVFRVADIIAVRAAVAAARAPILHDYHDIPGGVVLTFADPAGNPLQVVQYGVSVATLAAPATDD